MKIDFAAWLFVGFVGLTLIGCDRAGKETKFQYETPAVMDVNKVFTLVRVEALDDTGVRTAIVRRMTDGVLFRAVVSGESREIAEGSLLKMKVKHFRSTIGGEWMTLFVVQGVAE